MIRLTHLAVALAAASVVVPRLAAAATVTVTSGNMGDWAFDNRDAGGTVGANPTAGGGMVTGPATPPLGTGSARLFTGTGITGGDGAEELRNTGYDGVLLSSITSLSYSTYVTSWNGQQAPYLTLEIAPSAGAPADSNLRLFFEPAYQTPTSGNASLPDQGPVSLNTWQSWNALTGGWWSNAGGGTPGTGVISLADYIALHPDAVLANTADGLGAVQLRVGFASAGNQFDGNVDALKIGVSGSDTTYDFEAAPVPEPPAAALLAAGLLGLPWLRRRHG
jgi:hypothetical protein